MSERLSDYPNHTVFGLSQGISLDGSRSIIDYPLVLAEEQEKGFVIRSSPRTAGNYFVRREDVGAESFYQGSDGTRIPFPFGTVSARRKEDEIQNVMFDFGPRFYDESTMELFNSLIQSKTEEEELNLTFDLLKMVTCTVSELDGVEFHSIGSEIMFATISPQGHLEINSEWQETDRNFQSVCQYSNHQEPGEHPFFELSIGSMTQYSQPGIKERECLIVAGLSYTSLDANAIHASLLDLVVQERANEEEMREVIDPYIRLIEL